MSRDTRPVFLNLFQIRLPLQGIASITHRVTGVLLFLAIPLILWLLMKASASSADYDWVIEVINNPIFLPFTFLITWVFWHHLLAGIRFLLLDVDIGIARQASRQSALLAIVLGLIAAILSTLAWYFL